MIGRDALLIRPVPQRRAERLALTTRKMELPRPSAIARMAIIHRHRCAKRYGSTVMIQRYRGTRANPRFKLVRTARLRSA